jgi:type I restriction enzyme R subunit
MHTDTSEKGLESLIVESLVNDAGYRQGRPEDYDRGHAVDLAMLMEFLRNTQPDMLAKLGIESEGPARTKFLHRLQGEIAKNGTVHMLRRGISHGPGTVDLFYGTPNPSNRKAVELYSRNIFSVTRQVRYSEDNTKLALDMVVFINGLPVITFELKNRLTKQNAEDAERQYKNDRDEKDLLFQFGRCAVHFAVDDHEVRMCTHLMGKYSWFLPFNRGYNDGAGIHLTRKASPPTTSGRRY